VRHSGPGGTRAAAARRGAPAGVGMGVAGPVRTGAEGWQVRDLAPDPGAGATVLQFTSAGAVAG
jgi:hypothetical protein